MLNRSYRLRSSSDFNKTYKFGRSTNAPSLYIKTIQTHQAVTRVAVVVSKKVSKRAVTRNKIKRRIIEIVRESWPVIRPGFHVIITAKTDSSTSPVGELKKEVLDCLQRAQLLQ